MQEFDFRVITIVKYREVLLNEGQEAADNSLIPGLPILLEMLKQQKSSQEKRSFTNIDAKKVSALF